MIAQKARANKNNKKLIGTLICAASVFCFISMLAPPLYFIGRPLRAAFGVGGFLILTAIFLAGIGIIKNYQISHGRRMHILRVLFIVCIFAILELAFNSSKMAGGLGDYAKYVYDHISPAGIIGGILPFGVRKLVYTAGAYVFFVLAAAACVALMVDYGYARKQFRRLSSNKKRTYIDAGSGQPLQKGGIGEAHAVENNEKPVLITLNGKVAPQPKLQSAQISSQEAPTFSSQPQSQLSATEAALAKLGLRKNAATQKANTQKTNEQLKNFILTPPAVQTPPIIRGDSEKAEEVALNMQKQDEATKDFLDAIRPAKRIYDVSAEETLKQNYHAPRIMPQQQSNEADEPQAKSQISPRAQINETPIIEPEKAFDQQLNRPLQPYTNIQAPSELSQKQTEQPHQPRMIINDNQPKIIAPENRIIERGQKSTEDLLSAPHSAAPIKPSMTEEVNDIEERINNLINNESFASNSASSVQSSSELKNINAGANINDNVFPPDDVQDFPDEISQEIAEDAAVQQFESTTGLTDNNPAETERVREFKQKWQADRHVKPVQESMLAAGEKNKKKEPPKFTLSSNIHYNKPPVDLLRTVAPIGDDETEEQRLAKVEVLEAVLDNFKVPAKVTEIIKGPTVTRYELQMPPGKTVKLIQSYASDIAMALAIKGRVRIEAPIPGKSAVGIEVPNSKIAMIGAREIIESPEFQKGSPLTFALGKDVTGSQTMVCDLMEMPHLLIAGSTGSGKSVCLNVLICSLIYRMSPEDLRIILIDPKRVEFTSYIGLPHLIIPEPLTEPRDAINALIWIIEEMERRYNLFRSVGVNHIVEYNNRESVRGGAEAKLPIILIVIDELADLITTSRKDVEDRIRRITALARASGIHLVVATQRPSADVITGTIKVNLPSRIAFQVTNWVDSKTILDQNGAEDLVGKGDMLYAPRNFSEPKRVQCAYISLEEVKAVVNYIKANNESYFDEQIKNDILKKPEEKVAAEIEINDDGKPELDKDFYKALKLVVETRTASVSLLQRRFSFGFSRAARIIDQMEQQKFISPQDENKSKPRSVYLTMDEFNAIFPESEA